MKKLILLAAMVSGAAGAQQSVTVAGQKNASPWLKAESQHFIVFSNTSNDDVRQLLDNLEKLDHVLRLYTNGYRIAALPKQKITLYYHDNIGGFNAAVTDAPPEAVGLYNSCGHGVQGYATHLSSIDNMRPEQLAKQPLNSSQSYIFEAYTRHFLYRYTDIRMPAAYIDGFAQYFSTVRFADKQMSLGRVPGSAGRYIYFLDNGHGYKLKYQDILEPAASKDTDVTAEPAVRLEFMTKSWLLTHYMLSSSDNLERRDLYLNQTHLDTPIGQAFTTAFNMKVPELDTAMWRYRNKGIQVTQLEVPSLPTARRGSPAVPERSDQEGESQRRSVLPARRRQLAAGRTTQRTVVSAGGRRTPDTCAQPRSGFLRGGLCAVSGAPGHQRQAGCRHAGRRHRRLAQRARGQSLRARGRAGFCVFR
jgi:hypothetical protein